MQDDEQTLDCRICGCLMKACQIADTDNECGRGKSPQSFYTGVKPLPIISLEFEICMNAVGAAEWIKFLSWIA